MKTIIINIDESANTRRILEAVRLLKGVENASIKTDDEPNITTGKAIREARKGHVTHCENVSDLMDKLESEI
jgi:metal-sulfur cluster biosynthetic enzyme